MKAAGEKEERLQRGERGSNALGRKKIQNTRHGGMIYLSGLSQEREFQTEIVITSVEMIGGEDDVSFTLNNITSKGIFPKTKMMTLMTKTIII